MSILTDAIGAFNTKLDTVIDTVQGINSLAAGVSANTSAAQASKLAVDAALASSPSAAALTVNLAASGGAGLVGWIQAGAGTVSRGVRDKLRESVSAEDYSSIQAALDANPSKQVKLTLPAYSLSTTLVLGDGQSLVGNGRKATILTYTGTGTAVSIISSLGTGNRIYTAGLRDLLITTSTGAIGVDVDSLSEGTFDNLTIAGFSNIGFSLHSSTSGGAVYNRLYNVKAQSCGTGFKLFRDGVGTSSYTSDNSFTACRANVCGTGFDISGGNHNAAMHSQIEACTVVGVLFSEPATASTQQNIVAFSRFENNLLDVSVGAGVADSVFNENMYVNGDKFTDAGLRTARIGSYGNIHRRYAPTQEPGGSWRYVRTANGGTQVPAFVVNDASSVNSPVTLEVQNVSASLLSRALRVRYGGDAGTVKFGIVPISGKITDLSTTNGPVGSASLTAAIDTVISNTAVTASSFIFLQPANASASALVAAKGAHVSLKTEGVSFSIRPGDATAAAGTEVFHYWIVN